MILCTYSWMSWALQARSWVTVRKLVSNYLWQADGTTIKVPRTLFLFAAFCITVELSVVDIERAMQCSAVIQLGFLFVLTVLRVNSVDSTRSRIFETGALKEQCRPLLVRLFSMVWSSVRIHSHTLQLRLFRILTSFFTVQPQLASMKALL